MSDNLDKYLPEFDENENKKQADWAYNTATHRYAHIRVQVEASHRKMLDAESNKLQRIETIIKEPSRLIKMPGIPSADDLRRMMGEE